MALPKGFKKAKYNMAEELKEPTGPEEPEPAFVKRRATQIMAARKLRKKSGRGGAPNPPASGKAC